MNKKNIILLLMLCTVSVAYSQNSFNAIKTSKRGGIMTTLVNPADLAGMPQKFDFNLIGVDVSVINNKVDFTFDEAFSGGDVTDRLFDKIGVEPLDMRTNIDIMGPSLAVALNKRTTAGIMTRLRTNISMNNIDVAFGKALVDGEVGSDLTLPYTTPDINSMNTNVVGWAELGGSLASEIFKTKKHSLKIGATGKVLFSGAYANGYFNNFKMTINADTAGQNVTLSNGSGQMGLEYSGSNDPLNDIVSNIFGGPKGFSMDAGLTYTFKDNTSKHYRVKIGASLLDIGSINFDLNSENSKKFRINNTTVTPDAFQGDNIDEIIANVKGSGLVSEEQIDSSINLTLPMAYNFIADVNVWKPLYITFNLQRRATDINDVRNVNAANYFTVTPRIEWRFAEFYAPFSFSEIQGTTIGAGMKLGPLYVGSSSILSALGSQNKAIDVHFGIRAGFGKRFKDN